MSCQIKSAHSVPITGEENRPTSVIKFLNIGFKRGYRQACRVGRFPGHMSRIRVSLDLTAATWEARRRWYSASKILQENDCKPRILYLAKVYNKNVE